MNYYGAKELAESFRTVRKNTLVVAEEIGEDKYTFSPAPGVRTVAQTLVHIALGSRMNHQVHGVEKRTTLQGFDFPAYMAAMSTEMEKPRSKAQIITLLREEGDKFAKWVETLSDDFLGERISMPQGGTPPSRTRFDMIMAVKEHEMHHRGQLMLIERMVGVVPHLTRDMQARMAAMMANAGAPRPA
jgi:uncharacterized damage-inducible protein DinB